MDKLLPKIKKTSTCWIWTSHLTGSGYAQYSDKGKNRVVHKMVYEMLVGKVPDGLELDHLCKVKKCVNPKHLEPVTHSENLIRSYKGRERTQCKRGHEYKQGSYKIRMKNGRETRTCLACCNIRQKEWRLSHK